MEMPSADAWLPYCGPAPTPAEWLARWNGDPWLGAVFVIGATLYCHRTRPDRIRYAAALTGLALLFFSPLCALTSALFAARFAHHAILATVAVPLLVAATPPDRLRIPGSLPLWTFVHGLMLWLWHAPAPYAWALSGDARYWLMEGSIALTAFGFWWAVRAAAPIAGVGALLFTCMHMGLLGALITFSATPLYAAHDRAPLMWGLTPLEDQQLAGLIMWGPAAGLYLAAALLVAGRWLRAAKAAPAR